jgi:hypothetical protein
VRRGTTWISVVRYCCSSNAPITDFVDPSANSAKVQQ